MLEQIRGSGERCRRVVAMLSHEKQSRGNDGGSGRNIISIVTVASGAYYIALDSGQW